MLLSSAINEPFLAEKRILLRLAVVPFLPFNLLSCSYLQAFFQTFAKDDLDLLYALGLYLFCYVFIVRRNPIVRSPEDEAAYRLQQRMHEARAALTPERALLAVRVLFLRLLARLLGLRAFYRGFQASRSVQAHRALSADASRASKDSARYKSLLKRYE